MLEITKYILDQLRADSILMDHLGGTETDSRIYSWEPPFDIIYDSNKEAALFYKDEQFSKDKHFSFPSQKGNINYYFQCVSPNKTLSQLVIERIEEILCDEYYSGFETTNWKVLLVKNNGTSDGEIVGNTGKILYVRNIIINLKEVFRRLNYIYSSP